MLEYLIRPVEEEFFDLHSRDWSEALKPSSFSSKVVEGWGNLRLEISGCEVSFSDEDVGIQICFENCDISEEKANKIVQEICSNLINFTNQPAKVITL